MDTFHRHVKPANSAFSLIEMIVVITILLFLTGILYPSLQTAREEAQCVTCLANLRSCMQGLHLLAEANGLEYPAAYEFLDESVSPAGYVTWAGLLVKEGFLPEAGCTCPAFTDGGLPAANPAPGEQWAGQSSETPGAVDESPRRCAYTVNEAICPQPRFSSESYPHPARRVSTDEVESDVILLTEFHTDWRVLSPGDTTCRSYLPVHGLVGMGLTGPDKYDLNAVSDRGDRPCFRDGCYRRYRAANLIPEPVPNLANPPRMNLIGRNHSRCDSKGFRKTSFAYTDGHAVSTTVSETLFSRDWGHKVYSVVGDQRITEY